METVSHLRSDASAKRRKSFREPSEPYQFRAELYEFKNELCEFGSDSLTEVDGKPDAWNPKEILHCSFESRDEGDPVCGRGCVKREGERLLGQLAFHPINRCTFKPNK